ncbi:MAG: RsiV family protein [Clostridium sp.]|nr:RsiV family protein [Clostridium sp.]
MKTKRNLLNLLLGGLLLLSSACGQDNSRSLETSKLQRKCNLTLTEDPNSPACEIDLVIEQVISPAPIASLINHEVALRTLGYDCDAMETAADSFVNEQYKAYVGECAESYAANPDTKDWCVYRHYVRVEEKSSYPDIVSYESIVESKKGNGRKCTARLYLNFDARNGRSIRLNDMFKPGYEQTIEPLLMRELLKKFNCVSLAQLNRKGVLCNNRLYVPENFRPGKNEVKFLYNTSEIAPYKTGEIILSIPRSLLEQVIKFK